MAKGKQNIAKAVLLLKEQIKEMESQAICKRKAAERYPEDNQMGGVFYASALMTEERVQKLTEILEHLKPTVQASKSRSRKR